jgi:hypothetical protein
MESHEGRKFVTHKPSMNAVAHKRERSGLNRKDQSKGRFKTFWDEAVIMYLIKGGTNGWTWEALAHRYQTQVSRAELKAFLEALKAEGKVDNFTVSEGVGPPRTVWRATTKIMVD